MTSPIIKSLFERYQKLSSRLVISTEHYTCGLLTLRDSVADISLLEEDISRRPCVIWAVEGIFNNDDIAVLHLNTKYNANYLNISHPGACTILESALKEYLSI